MAGDTGVVVCGTTYDPTIPLLVAWDGWSQGHDNVQYCECGDGGSTDGSNGWYVHCDEIKLSDPSVDCACNAIYEVGDIVIATVDSPSGASGVMAGDTGVVVCGTTYDPTIHFVGCMGWLEPRP